MALIGLSLLLPSASYAAEVSGNKAFLDEHSDWDELKVDISLASVKVVNPKKVVYNGLQQRPSVTVKLKSTERKKYVVLQENIDYILSYENNIAANTDLYSSQRPLLTVTGIGAYTGSVTTDFNIYPRLIKWADIDEIGSVSRIGAVNLLEYRSIRGSKKKCVRQLRPLVGIRNPETGCDLLENYDYTLSYGKNNMVGLKSGTVKIKGKGNYKGSVTLKFRIRPHYSNLELIAQNYPSKVRWNKDKSVRAMFDWVREHAMLRSDLESLPEDESEDWTQENVYDISTATVLGTDIGTVGIRLPENYWEYVYNESNPVYYIDTDNIVISVHDASFNNLKRHVDYEWELYQIKIGSRITGYGVKLTGMGHYTGSVCHELTYSTEILNPTAKGLYFGYLLDAYTSYVYTHRYIEKEPPSQFALDHVTDTNWYDYYPAYRNAKASYTDPIIVWDAPLIVGPDF